MIQKESFLLSEIALLVGGELIGDGSTIIHSAGDTRDAQSGGIVFAETAKFMQDAARSSASAILTRQEIVAQQQQHVGVEEQSRNETQKTVAKPMVLVANPRAAFVKILEAMSVPWTVPNGIHASAIVEEGVQLGNEVCIGPHVWIEKGAIVGNHVVVMAGVKIGTGCVIGDGTIIYPNVVLYPRVKIGRSCLLHAGCVLGGDGFGYEFFNGRLNKIPHVGVVEIGDGVEIGANTCIDRAKTGVTSIGAGTKVDNLVHIAHNVHIGQSSLIIAQVGLAGSVQVGNGVILAGQVGVADHITIGDRARVGAQGGVIGNVTAGESVSGYPARPHARKMREYAAAAALPDYLKRIRELERRLSELETRTVPNTNLSIIEEIK